MSENDDRGDPIPRDLIWDPASSSWRALEAWAFRMYHSATLLEDGSVLFVGGQHDESGWHPPDVGPFASEIVRYDPALDRWTKEGESLAPRDRHGAALLSDGSVLAIGGQSQEWGHVGVAFGSTERWTPATSCGTADP